MSNSTTDLPSIEETSSLGIKYLKRYWAKAKKLRSGEDLNHLSNESNLDKALLDSLGLGLRPTIEYIFQSDPGYDQFENWIKANAQLNARTQMVERFNKLFEPNKTTFDQPSLHAISQEDMDFFNEHGYIIIHNAVSIEDCQASINGISNFLETDLSKEENWYKHHKAKHGIMVEFFDDTSLEKNRFAPKIWAAYEQLLTTKNLWVSTDRVSINPPETAHWKFPGPHLHLDIEPTSPLPFGLQGILYLTDVAEDQGALTVIPGFHHKIDDWIASYVSEHVPLIDVFDKYESKPLAAQAGDFIIWHHGLPHGSSPNQNSSPRIAQYINLYAVPSIAMN